MSDSTDYVNKPPHYTKGGVVQSIDYIKQQLGDNFKYYLEGSMLKYNHRYKYKENPLEDLKKSQWYLNRLIEELSTND
tara:strand:+ start:780 stop:1013 length:234 start_codon:yes stop_codon:yes gene_type:complete